MEWNIEEYFSMEWNMEWEIFSMEWKWNGMEENCQCGIWKNRLPFHSLPSSVAYLRSVSIYSRTTIFAPITARQFYDVTG